jgi:hypothetical protein
MDGSSRSTMPIKLNRSNHVEYDEILPEVFQSLYEKHCLFYSATRKNIKRVMMEEQGQLFKKRNRIELVWDVLKERFQLVFHLARSVTGLFRHYFYSIASYLVSISMDSSKINLIQSVNI